MLPLLSSIFCKYNPGEQGLWTLAIDDSLTKRSGPHFEVANIDRNLSPGPSDGDLLYGYNWVCLAMVLSHPMYGMIAMPLLSLLYVRKGYIEAINASRSRKLLIKHVLPLISVVM